jgi:pimeloyl-ACP methyl ester carboxylesterase
VSPEDLLDKELRALSMPVLVVFGTEDSEASSERGREYLSSLRAGLYMLVYDAGRAIERERPEAFASLIGDFVTRGGREFLAPPDSTLLNP